MECRYMKRPPQSLRLKGANALDFHMKIKLISDFETGILKAAIAKKKEEIQSVENKIKNVNIQLKPLTKRQGTRYFKHYKKKLAYFNGQNSTKWKDWPDKQKPRKKNHDEYRSAKQERKAVKDIKMFFGKSARWYNMSRSV